MWTLSSPVKEDCLTALDVYTRVTDDMQRTTAANINHCTGKAAPQEDASQPGQETDPAMAAKPRMTLQALCGPKRKSGASSVTEINNHLFEGRYSSKWLDDKKHAHDAYAHTCEEKLKAKIADSKRLMTLDEVDGRGKKCKK